MFPWYASWWVRMTLPPVRAFGELRCSPQTPIGSESVSSATPTTLGDCRGEKHWDPPGQGTLMEISRRAHHSDPHRHVVGLRPAVDEEHPVQGWGKKVGKADGILGPQGARLFGQPELQRHLRSSVRGRKLEPASQTVYTKSRFLAGRRPQEVAPFASIPSQ